MTIRQLLLLYSRHATLRLGVHCLLWAALWVTTEDPDVDTPFLARLLELAYAMAAFYLLFYGPVPRWWAQGRYAGPLAAGIVLVLSSGPILYEQYQLANPHSTYAFLPAYRAYGPLAIFLSGRYFFYALFNGLVLNLAPPALLKLLKTLAEGQLARQRTEQLAYRLHLDALLGQVSPHFLFNTLNNLYGLVLDDDSRAPVIARQLAALLRYTEELAAYPAVPLQAEADFLDDFLALARIRYGAQVSLESYWQLGDEAEAGLPPLLLLPLVENAVKHGLGQHVGAAWVRVRGEARPGELVVTVTNSCYPASQLLATGSPGGLGLVTLRERLRLLYPNLGAFPLTLVVTASTFVATLRLPLWPAPAQTTSFLTAAPSATLTS
ncbi:MAG: sensor histidine kinase [Hymenobacter sp.]|nr:sensor histidine kinase [Hymenobacter sp.]